MRCFSILNLILIIGICLLQFANGAKILSIFGYPGPSQYIMASALLKGLAEQGHEVTSISAFPQKQPIKNFRDIAILENLNIFDEILSETAEEMKEPNFFEETRKFGSSSIQMITNVLENPQVKDIMKNEKFDLLIIEVLMCEALLGLGEHFKAPMVGVSTLGTMTAIDYVVGNPSPPSYIPHMSLPYGNRMSLKERFCNIINNAIDNFYSYFIMLPPQEKLYKKYFPTATLTLDEARKNVSMVLLNQHFSLSFPRPYVPNMIEVGGLHIKQKPDPLPSDLQEFLDNATDGAIYFSMGSNIKSKDFPAETQALFLDTFKELKVKVLWKFEDESLQNLPDNVFIKAWYPQPSVLAHPNVKLFITHGGFLSTTETIFHGKPILGIPVFADQPMNVQNAINAGYALSVKLDNITKDSLKAAIQELITNDRYTKTVQKLSKRFRDLPQTHLEKAIYWIEYVLRHDGAAHLRNAGQDLNFWQYHNIDVFVILIGGFVLLVVSIILVVYFLNKLLCSKKSNRKSRKTKRS